MKRASECGDPSCPCHIGRQGDGWRIGVPVAQPAEDEAVRRERARIRQRELRARRKQEVT